MRKAIIVTVFAAFIAATSISAYAHCGACGADHSDKTKQAKATTVEEAKLLNIVETAVAAGSFNTLVAAVQTAGLDEVLAGEGPFTVFAPTDEAFAALPAGTVEALLKDKQALTAILTYHVVPGLLKAEKVVKEKSFATVNGESFEIKVNDDGVMVDNAKIVQTDIVCANGVIHVIDAVILPPAEG